MATLTTETWTGADGAAWPAQWTTGLTPTGGAATIAANTGRLATGAQGAYAGTDRVARRLTTAFVDTDAVFRFRFVSGESYPIIMGRANTTLDTGSGYGLDLGPTTSRWARFVDYTKTDLGPAAHSFTFTTGTWYWVRVRVVGSSLRARFWADGAAEPTTWPVNLDVTDTTIAASGSWGFSVGGGAAATSSVVEFDDLTVTDGAAANAEPTANAGADQTVEPWATVTLTGTDADADGTIATRTWTQLTGAVVTLAGSGASRTFTAPPSTASATLTFRYTVTDNAGATTTDDVAVTVLPAAERILIGGAWVPARITLI